MSRRFRTKIVTNIFYSAVTELIIQAGPTILRSGLTLITPERAQSTQKTRRPVTLMYYEMFATKEEAMKREYAIKQLSRQKKLALIRSHQSYFLKMFWEIAVNEASFF